MTGNVDHYATLTFILLTFTFSVNQGQGQKRTCDLLSRPHPLGLCGAKLAQTHDNLCFLIRQSYPQFFPQNKRSPALDVDNLLLPPLQRVFVSNGALSLGPAVFHETPFSPRRNGKRVSSLKTYGWPEDIPEDQSTNTILRILNKRRARSTRSLVCECCYGPCTTRIMARYC